MQAAHFISRPVKSRKECVEALNDFLPDKIIPVCNTPQTNGVELDLHTSRRENPAESEAIIHQLELRVKDRTAELEVEIEQRKRTEKKYRKIFENTKEGIFQTTMEGKFIEVNSAFARMFGLSSPGEIIESVTKISSHLHKSAELFRTLIEQDNVEGFETKAYRKDGSRSWVSINAHTVRDGAGKIKFFEGTVSDITDRMLAQEALQEREAKLQSILNSAPVGIGVVVNRSFTEVNSRFCEMLGYSASELLGRNSRMVYPSDEAYEYVGRVKYEMIEAKGLGTVETQLCRKNGKIIDVLMSSIPISSGHLDKGMTFTVLDITERKRMEDVLKRANYELLEKDAARTAELERTNEILLAEIVERKSTERKLLAAQKNLRAMASEVVFAEERSRQRFATDLHDTVVQTLGAAKLRSQLIQHHIPKDVRPAFAEVQNMLTESIKQSRQIMAEMSPPVLNELGIAPALEWLTEETGRQHCVIVRFESMIKPVSLPREIEVLLYQATRELLINVVKHSHAKSALVKFFDDGLKLCVEVTDDGKGFDMKETLRPDLKGGYGLYSIRERLRHIGGQLVIKSSPGKGTTVLIMAPREIEKKAQKRSKKVFPEFDSKSAGYAVFATITV